MTTNHSDRTHSILGGSSANRWVNCTGSVFLSRTVPKPETSEAAKEGTRAHEYVEKHLEGYLKYKLTGETSPTDLNNDLVEFAFGYTEAIWNNLLEKSVTGKAYGLEEMFTIDEKLELWGSVDFWCCYIDDKGKRVLAICDYKHGYHHVSADGNSQLAFYAVAIRKTIQKLGKDFDYARAAIFQPRAIGKDPYEETKFTAKQLDVWEKKFYKAAKTILVDKKPAFKVGDWCRWCPAQAVCKKYQKELSDNSALLLTNIDEPALPVPETMSDDSLLKIIDNKDRIESFLSAVTKYAISRYLQGSPVKGTKCVQGVSRRKWKDAEEEVIQNLKALGISDPFNKKLKGIGEIETELAKTMTKKEAKALLEPSTMQSSPSLTLVLDSDPREAAKIASDMLDVIN